ncbi:MAG: pyridoxamine 5'-phosphate oxidase family protein [Oscillospiraceae bacterium]|nr:pyridoxamine 5'-phosphate oxidase family protein [Oscillospiraceae bacterium]
MRRNDRAVTEIAEIRAMLDKAQVLRLGLLDAGYPYVVPLHFGYAYADGQFIFYMHSAREGHKLDLIRQDPHVCVEVEGETTLVSGGEVACNYGALFASFIGRGTAEIVEDPAEKCRGLAILMRQQTGKDFAIREEMAASVAVVKVVVTEFSAKARRV